MYGFSDNLLSVVPVKVKSSHPREHPCYSFVCVPKQDRGKFLPKIATELGCNPKAHFRILTEGNPVTLENGNIVHPFQVMEDAQPSQAMIFVFLPNENYLESLLDRAGEFEAYSVSNLDP